MPYNPAGPFPDDGYPEGGEPRPTPPAEPPADDDVTEVLPFDELDFTSVQSSSEPARLDGFDRSLE